MHQVFKARALLYAERLVVADHRSSLALAYRAYARALVGFHGAALEDLAATQINAAARKAELPKWADLIADFCMFDSQAVKIFSDPSQQQLAALLRVMMAEQSDSPGLTPKVACAESANSPECYRICDGYVIPRYYQHPDEREVQPDNGSPMVDQTIAARFTAIADLPAEVTKVIQRDRSENPARRRKIIQSLLDVQPATPADVADEIPWALMGRMLREISFYQAWRQMCPESETTGTGSIEDLPSLYADHPDAGFLRMAQASSAESRKAFRTLLETVDADGMEFQQWPLVDFLGRETNSNFRGPMFLNVAIQNRMDDVARDIVRRIQNEPNPNSVPRAKRLLAISPYHPTGRTTLIRFAWDQVRGQAADWERTSRTQSTVLVALGKQYAATNDSASARRLLKAMADVTPTAANVAALAIEYDHEGNHAAWEKTVERLVTLPDLRNRGTVHAQLVDNYMVHGEWQKARPHADAAIESGESAGLIGGASFFEAQRNWDNAEAAYRKASETDPAMSFKWYFYCKRTGHGDVKEAHKLGAKSMTDRQEQVSREPQAYMFMLTPPATYYLLAGKPEVARRYSWKSSCGPAIRFAGCMPR